MKFGFKIFVVSFLIIIISFGTGVFLLVNSVFDNSLRSKIEADTETNRYIAASLDALSKNSKSLNYSNEMAQFALNNFIAQVADKSGDSKIKIVSVQDTFMYTDDSYVTKLAHLDYGSNIYHDNGRYYCQVVTCMVPLAEPLYVETLSDITPIFEQRDSYIRIFQTVLLGVGVAASAILWAFTYYVTRPLKRLTNSAEEIASGDYSVRVKLNARKAGSEEVLTLSESFDTMAESMEKHVFELEEEARRRDDFVGNFTHELKTPLTSVIGYSDMLRSYELTDEKRRECADLIYREGKRLEALSTNLLDLLVLKNEGIKFEKISSKLLFGECEKILKFLLEKYGVTLSLDCADAVVLGEASLVKTLIYNLVDNAAKASKPLDEIKLSGVCEGKAYRITVSDKGRGIPSEELKKITEPFYMVDKSRARKQGGAGLGLALCEALARLHRGELKIESTENVGTSVSFTLPVMKEVRDEEI